MFILHKITTKPILIIAIALLVATAGCTGFTGDDGPDQAGADDSAAGAADEEAGADDDTPAGSDDGDANGSADDTNADSGGSDDGQNSSGDEPGSDDDSSDDGEPATADDALAVVDVTVASSLTDVDTDRITLENTGDGPLDVSGWTIVPDRPTSEYVFPDDVVLDAGGSVTIRATDATDASNPFQWATPDTTPLNEAGGTVLVLNATDGIVIDASYDSAGELPLFAYRSIDEETVYSFPDHGAPPTGEPPDVTTATEFESHLESAGITGAEITEDDETIRLAYETDAETSWQTAFDEKSAVSAAFWGLLDADHDAAVIEVTVVDDGVPVYEYRIERDWLDTYVAAVEEVADGTATTPIDPGEAYAEQVRGTIEVQDDAAAEATATSRTAVGTATAPL